MEPLPVLVGALVRLRPWRDDDVDAIHAACQDPETQRFTTMASPYRWADAVGFLEHYVDRVRGDRGGSFAVEALTAPGVLVGNMTLLHVEGEVGEIGYWTAPGHRGRGYAADALGVLADWAFAVRGAQRLELVIETANAASRAVAGRAGFVVQRREQAREMRDGSVRDVVVAALDQSSGRRMPRW